MVHVRKVQSGGKTYFYVVKTYRKKFGKRWDRYLHSFGTELPPKAELEEILKKREERVTIADFYEDLYEKCYGDHGPRAGKQKFVKQLKAALGMSEEEALIRWEQAHNLYLKLSGHLPAIKGKQKKERKLKTRYAMLHYSIGAPAGVWRALEELLAENPSIKSKSDIIRSSIVWTGEAVTKYGIDRGGDYPNNILTFYDNETMRKVVTVQLTNIRKLPRIQRSVRMHRDYYRRLRTIRDKLELGSIQHAAVWSLVFYFKAYGYFEKHGLLCEYATKSKEKKYGKWHKRVRCRLRGAFFKPTWCVDCRDYVPTGG